MSRVAFLPTSDGVFRAADFRASAVSVMVTLLKSGFNRGWAVAVGLEVGFRPAECLSQLHEPVRWTRSREGPVRGTLSRAPGLTLRRARQLASRDSDRFGRAMRQGR